MQISEQLKDKIKTILYSPRFIRDYIYCLFNLGYWSSSWRFRGLPIIQKHKTAKIIIGKQFVACSDPRQNSLGVFQQVIIKALSPHSIITIGKNVGISGASISGDNISIGNNVLIGSGVMIVDNDAHPIHPDLRNEAKYIKSSPIVIEDDVFIGARSIILKGVTIGKGSVIGAGSVVTKNIPTMTIATGNPAKVVKSIGDVSDYKNLKSNKDEV
jgi:acetyltransferase-like isoleucine patch superfamily enzyme